MKFFKLFLVIFLSVSNYLFAQEKETANQTLNYPVTLQNLSDALNLLNINVFNIGIPVEGQNKLRLFVYLDEYEKGGVEKKHEEIWSEIIGNGTPTGNDGKITLMIHKIDDIKFAVSIKTLGGMRVQLIDKAPQYNIEHKFELFKAQPLLPGKIIPVLLFGSMWHDPNLPADAVRFCMERQLNPDFSSEAFKLMTHYYIFSFEVKNI
ncbi:uncharacterized protein DUF5041 [Mucilaginibacter frigoritolerans]|uniref:Uncharacterized protein DUF5041 n=1 Tax=Mucilaginibacter frigoritolerans TaxID=652788 RepID=A0A562U8V6_9SPHI|nr:DUF5041 domain-containing protein [Mucilaginibacter frigoritolerans]TWJ02206.1 uncharacterized protein DUF5041 [Mucilaginibacter frigoritolerans]